MSLGIVTTIFISTKIDPSRYMCMIAFGPLSLSLQSETICEFANFARDIRETASDISNLVEGAAKPALTTAPRLLPLTARSGGTIAVSAAFAELLAPRFLAIPTVPMVLVVSVVLSMVYGDSEVSLFLTVALVSMVSGLVVLLVVSVVMFPLSEPIGSRTGRPLEVLLARGRLGSCLLPRG